MKQLGQSVDEQSVGKKINNQKSDRHPLSRTSERQFIVGNIDEREDLNLGNPEL